MTRLAFAVLLFFSVIPVAARDVYALQGRATGSRVDDCIALRWVGEVLFYNDAPTAGVITIRNVSNGGPGRGVPHSFVILPYSGTTLSEANVDWRPGTLEGIWVLHMDVPESVHVEGRIEIGEESCALGVPPIDGLRGRIAFPVFDSLQPPNVAKIHLGTDLSLIPAATMSRCTTPERRRRSRESRCGRCATTRSWIHECSVSLPTPQYR